jgi:hypothetical protein
MLTGGDRPHDSSLAYMMEQETAHKNDLHVSKNMPQRLLFLTPIAYTGNGRIRIGTPIIVMMRQGSH